MTRSSESPQPPTDRKRRESQLLVWGTEQTLAIGMMVGPLFSFSLRFPPRSRLGSRLNSVGSPLLWLNSVAVISSFPDTRRRRWHRSILSLRRRRNYFNLSILCAPVPRIQRIFHVQNSLLPRRSGGMIAAIPPLFLGQLPHRPSPFGWAAEARDLSVLLLRGACVPVCAVHTQSSYFCSSSSSSSPFH